jgi:hypothetical protein
MYAITADTQMMSSNELLKGTAEIVGNMSGSTSFSSLYTDKYLGAALSEIGKMYFGELDTTRTMLAEEYNIYSERYLSVCVTSFNVDMTVTSIGSIEQLSIKKQGTVGIDALWLNTSESSLDNNPEDLSNYWQKVGMQSSYLEASVLESVTGIEGISTMRIFDKAGEQGIDIVSISKEKANYTQLLSSLNITPNAYNEVAAEVEAGNEVLVPARDISVNSWSGTGFVIIEKTAAGESYTFRLSNGTNGGEITDPLNGLGDFYDSLTHWSYMISLILTAIRVVIAGIALAAALVAGGPLGAALSPFIVSCVFFGLSVNGMNKYIKGENTWISDAGKNLSLFWALGGQPFLLWVLNEPVKWI